MTDTDTAARSDAPGVTWQRFTVPYEFPVAFARRLRTLDERLPDGSRTVLGGPADFRARLGEGGERAPDTRPVPRGEHFGRRVA